MFEDPTLLASIVLQNGDGPSQVDQWGTFLEAVRRTLEPTLLAIIVVGIVLGLILGAIPGLGAVLGMTIVLPLTIVVDSDIALVLLVSIYSGALYGASISAILVNVPGTVAAAATTFDGYTMTQAGQSREALETSAAASALGGSLTMLLLFVAVPYLIPIVLAFGAPQVFLLALFGIVMIGVIASQDSTFKGITVGLFGVLVMTIGVSHITPQVRYTFGVMGLYNGLSIVAILIGMFALGEMLRIADTPASLVKEGASITGKQFDGVRNVLSNKFLTIKSALIGMVIGAIPGAGAGAANFFSYTEAVRSSSNPDEFGNANPLGVIAAESSNNSSVAGSLIPVLSFGIPGSASTAVLLGGFIVHGINPGVEMFTTNLHITYTMILALLLGNVLILGAGLFVITRIGSIITDIDTDILIPIILVFAIIGAIGIRSNWWDLVTVFVFGIIAFYMKLYNYSVIALVLGAVLSPIIESNLLRSLQLSQGSPVIFVNDPLSLLLVLLIVAFLVSSFVWPQLKDDNPFTSRSDR
ncbi:tripartite tricarboxylate transporter permease [Natrarchaeobius oligotrophus]|uniref:DUF112 domain-containing protein n=1 Tax=Natrarchaeobius chitinivorans TaxID=1679083 RepID=A0A3N6MHG8_NATCH|nr:tripartite tricarboxylate transporter permease [Natrarchaeobius chitinivorans]RQH02578.1 hypothetical protein EA472_04590 [Natrarchaeobius chitinivorans]